VTPIMVSDMRDVERPLSGEIRVVQGTMAQMWRRGVQFSRSFAPIAVLRRESELRIDMLGDMRDTSDGNRTDTEGRRTI